MSSETPPLSVVHVCAPADVGGLERVVQGLATGLARRGHDVSVVAVVEPGSDPSPLFLPIEREGVRTVALELPGRAYIQERRHVARLLDELQPSVLHTHGYRPDLLHGGWARRKGIATVSTLHGSSRMGGLSHVFEWLQERALRRFDAVVAVSPPLVETLLGKGVPRARIHAIPSGWMPPERHLTRTQARREMGLTPAGPKVIGWVGRLIPIKGCDVFLRALALIRASDWKACVIGDGPERAGLEQLTHDLGLEQHVIFYGALPEAARLFHAFDLFVLSSRSEGTPMVILEAMGAQVPIVATRVGGIPDMLSSEQEEAWLALSESPESLAQAITDALLHTDEAQSRGSRAFDRLMRDFDTQLWIRRHEEAYCSAIERRRTEMVARREPRRASE